MASPTDATVQHFPIRAVHLDLKGMPPTFSRLMELLSVFHAAHYNAVLVEWEDCFPWTIDPRFRCETAYSPDQVREFCRKANSLGMEIIPLIQCLGHMETPLSIDDYVPLREVPHRSDCLNPLAPGASQLIGDMIEDVLRLCPEVRYFHLGGDEAWLFGTHPETRSFIDQHGQAALYLHHVGPLLKYLNGRSVRPILWHDMMVHWSPDEIKQVTSQADLMVWGYRGHPNTVDPARHYNRATIDLLKQQGARLWCAGGFKGCDGMDGDLPDFDARHDNALAWAEIHRDLRFVGAVATGWSRYSATSMQCNPIDASLDTLADLGHIFYHGQSFDKRQQGCLEFLHRIGEGSRFELCRQAMSELAAARLKGWVNINELWHLLITSQQDPRRRQGAAISMRIDFLAQHLNEAREAAGLARRAFSGLVEPLWINRYLDERVRPLELQYSAIVQALSDIASDTSGTLVLSSQ